MPHSIRAMVIQSFPVINTNSVQPAFHFSVWLLLLLNIRNVQNRRLHQMTENWQTMCMPHENWLSVCNKAIKKNWFQCALFYYIFYANEKSFSRNLFFFIFGIVWVIHLKRSRRTKAIDIQYDQCNDSIVTVIVKEMKLVLLLLWTPVNFMVLPIIVVNSMLKC